MEEALREARRALEQGEVPVGAVIAEPDGRVLARAHNEPISRCDPTAHAEILAIRRACSLIRNYRLNDTVLVTTIEPCIMCVGAAVHARVGLLAFGAHDAKAGAAVSLYRLPADERLNHRIEIVSGILEDECRSMLQEFFRERRKRTDE